MKINLLFSIFCFLVLFVNSIKSQQDVIYDPNATCEIYNGDPTCDQFLATKSIYIPSGYNQSYYINQVKETSGLLPSFGGKECLESSTTYTNLCSFFLVGCIQFQTSTNVTVSLPKRTCRSSCQYSLDLCTIPDIVYSCESVNSKGTYLYPITNQIYDLTAYGGNSSTIVQCLDPVSIVGNFTLNTTASCPAPLLYHETTDREADKKRGYYFTSDNSNCVLDCLAPIFTKKEWKLLFDESAVLSILSTFLCLFLLITYAIINQKKSQFDYQFSIFISGVFLMSLSGMVTGIAGPQKSFCPEPGRIAINSDAICGSTGFLFQFGLTFAIMWFGIMSFEIFWSVKFMNKPLHFLKYYIIVTLILSTLFSTIPYNNVGIQYARGTVLCWIRGSAYQTALMWVPMGIVLTVATICILLVCLEIYRILKSTGRGGIIKLQLKPFLMIFLIYFSFVYMFIFEFYMRKQTDIYYSKIPDYANCLARENIEGGNPDSCRLAGPTLALMGSYVYFLRIFGTYCFLLYGISSKTKRIWLKSKFFNNSYVARYISRYFSKESKNEGTSSTQSVSASKHHIELESTNTADES
ncbi:G-protein-coupled receptor family protein [Tieghemostelium lacteum]|uniref:G-protein-coupled receptor family protein n=1 Tax=Tieghemostelium lacteum TaxID=361077 RepID=A0A152A8Q7_TIELA|nr:G-protein-coupled receptor family protein [Tieghemostelium lacteum]|eukprot:KYR02616.1 G-protein-coupled receptor family protein [Tieghemostelium lacteum]